MNISENAGSSWRRPIIAAFSTFVTVHSDMAMASAIRSGCPARHPSPKKSPPLKMATTASFPCLESTLKLNLALRDIENVVCRVALGENGIVGMVFGDRSATVGLARMAFQSKGVLSFLCGVIRSLAGTGAFSRDRRSGRQAIRRRAAPDNTAEDETEAVLVAVWNALPRLRGGQMIEVAAHLIAAGVSEPEIALLLSAQDGEAAATPAREWPLRADSTPLRFAGSGTPVHGLLEALGAQRRPALGALRGIEPGQFAELPLAADPGRPPRHPGI